MSTDYTACRTLSKAELPADLTASANHSVSEAILRSYCQSGKEWVAQGAIIYIITAASTNGHALDFQKSNTSGDMSANTSLGSVTIGTADVAGTKKVVNFSASAGILGVNQQVRAYFTSAGADATLKYSVEIFGNSSL